VNRPIYPTIGYFKISAFKLIQIKFWQATALFSVLRANGRWPVKKNE
jgi:hypothetical protein